MMGTFEDHCKQLAELETFDPVAFQGESKSRQSVCDFVLALALFYNDFSNVVFAGVLLHQAKPRSPLRRSREWGCWHGIWYHLTRLEIGLVHELLELVRKNLGLLDDDMLSGVVKQLTPTTRKAWEALVETARGGTPKDSLGRALLLIRNTVIFHYDPKSVSQGYVSHFLGPEKRDDLAFISRGTRMSESRFYFADAAVQDRLERVGGTEAWSRLTTDLPVVFEALNRALVGIVERFTQKRAGAYRPYSDGVA
jgi:hypothetical protein